MSRALRCLSLTVAALSSSCGILGLTPLPCVETDDCINGICISGVCRDVAEVAGEGEGDIVVGEGEGDIVVGEGEGDIVVGEGEGDTVGEGEGDTVGEGEGDTVGEGEGEVVFVGCGDLDVAGDEDCDDGNVLGGDGCSADCETEVLRCGVMVPASFTASVVAGVDDEANRCFTSLAAASIRFTNGIYLSPGTYDDTSNGDFPFHIDQPLRGASASQVTLGSLAITTSNIVTLETSGSLQHLTVVGGRNDSGADVVLVDIGSGTISIRDADLRGPGDLVFMNGGPDALVIEGTVLSGGGAVSSGSSSTTVDISLRNNVFLDSEVSINGARSVNVFGNDFSLSFNTLNSIDGAPSTTSTLQSNSFHGDRCQFAFDFGDGVHTAANNVFEVPCRAITVSSRNADVTLGNNVFVADVDVEVRKGVSVDASAANDWTGDDTQPCDGIRVITGASVVTEAGICDEAASCATSGDCGVGFCDPTLLRCVECFIDDQCLGAATCNVVTHLCSG